ncbi:MAG TPA: hypothetical protein VIF62_39765 [Labilithrix sp.]|jgi:hypothetical protein
MTNKGAIAAGLLALLVAHVSPSEAQAQPACNDLDGLRSLFNEAYKDEQEKRYDQALEKFRTVEKCKASPNVRYRIASVLEAQGHLREARDTFRSVVSTGDASDPKQKPIMQSSDERAAQLDKRIPKLVLKPPANPPEGTTITVDGHTVASTATPIELDPGDHTVQASAPTAKQPFESHVKLGESGQVELQIVLEGPGAPTCAAGTTWNGKDCAPDKPVDSGGKSNVLAYAALGAGAVLVIGGVIMFVARKSDIDDINKLCPDVNNCNPANKSAVDSDKSQANLFLPLGIGFEVVGLAAAGFGAYMLLKPAPADNAAPTQSPSGGLRIAPRYVRGGAILGVGTAF